MKIKKRMIVITAMLLSLRIQPIFAAHSVGYNHLVVPPHTDVLLTVPFTQPAEGTYTVDTVTASEVTVVDTLSGTYANIYYVRFTSGNGKGLCSTISDNGTNHFELADTEILSYVSSGDSFIVYPHETLETVFPDGMKKTDTFAGCFEASEYISPRKTEILTFDNSATGTNKSSSNTYYYRNNNWRRFGSNPNASFNDAVLLPQQYFILRNNGGDELKVFTLGHAAAIPVARLLKTEPQDNDVVCGAGFPTGMTLAQLNLGGTSAFVTSLGISPREDELLVFDNSATGLNKSAAHTFYYRNDAWRRFGSNPNQNFDDFILAPGSAILIRKNGGTSSTATWFQPSPY